MKQVGHKEESIKSQADMIGRYMIKHPIFMIRKPRLRIYRNEDNGKVEAEIFWIGFKKQLHLNKHKERHWVFQFNVDIFTIDVVINFITIEEFEGFIDTPVGDFRFTGKKVSSS